MNIIFGIDEANKLQKKYIVLELDTVAVQGSNPITAFCVIEKMPLNELPKADKLTQLHSDLLSNYKSRNWDFCIQALQTLMGCWDKEMDSFYDILKSRILEYKENEPDISWNGIVLKN